MSEALLLPQPNVLCVAWEQLQSRSLGQPRLISHADRRAQGGARIGCGTACSLRFTAAPAHPT